MPYQTQQHYRTAFLFARIDQYAGLLLLFSLAAVAGPYMI